MLGEVRDEIFKLLKCLPDDLILDLSGGSGFLTWEACARSSNGGVWSRCNNVDEHRRMRDWVNHFEFLSRPRVFILPWDAQDREVIKEEEKSIQFDAVMGYNLFGNSPKQQILETIGFIMENNVNAGGRLVLSQIRNNDANSFHKLFYWCLDKRGGKQNKEKGLWNRIRELETVHRMKVIEENAVISSADFKAMGFRQVRNFKREFKESRTVQVQQIRSWFKVSEKENLKSIIPQIVKNFSSQDLRLIQNVLEGALQGEKIPWSMEYEFWQGHL
jgi:hypothetical protein